MSDPFELGATDLASVAERQNLKWTTHPPGVLAAWVADMDLATAPFLRDVLLRHVDAGELGYPPEELPEQLIDAFVARAHRQWGWNVEPSRVRVVTDVMTGICQTIEALTDTGDEIIVPTPAYPPLLDRPAELGRSVVEVAMADGPHGPSFDIDALDDAVTPRTRLVAIINPHNPTGRVFRRSELEALLEFAARHDLVVISDEIHADLIHGEGVHVPLATIGDDARSRAVTITAATKAFNMAGFRCAVAVMPDADQVAGRFDHRPASVRGEVSSLSARATIAAWREGEPWLSDVKRALEDRRDHLFGRLSIECPAVVGRVPEATFLAWLDVSEFDLGDDPGARLVEKAKVALNSGPDFGAVGAGHVRLNFATPWAVLDEAIDRLVAGLNLR